MYYVTRQSNFYDSGAYSVEIAGGLDNVSPGALAQTLNGDFSESSDPREAVEDAIRLRKEWIKRGINNPDYMTDGTIPFTLTAASSVGLYPTVEDGLTAAGLRRWAKAMYDRAPKCDKCGDVCESADNYRDVFSEPFTACSDSCASRYVEDEAEFQARMDEEDGEVE